MTRSSGTSRQAQLLAAGGAATAATSSSCSSPSCRSCASGTGRRGVDGPRPPQPRPRASAPGRRPRLRRRRGRRRATWLRPCFVNYRTREEDVLALVEIVAGGRGSDRRPMTREQARERFAEARVARIATASDQGAPRMWSRCASPWSTTRSAGRSTRSRSGRRELRRLVNIAREPARLAPGRRLRGGLDATLVGAGGRRAPARSTDERERARALEALVAKYPQYRHAPPPGPVVQVADRGLVRWSAAETVEERS